MTTYSIPGDLEFIGKPLWHKITVKGALCNLRRIEAGMARDLKEFPGHQQAHLIAAVLGQARASRRRLEADEGVLRDAITDVQHLETLIKEIKLRAGEPDRQLGKKWRSKGRPPGDLTKAIDAALKDQETPGAKASSRWIFDHIVINNAGVLDPVHHSGLTRLQASPAHVKLADGSEITWLNFQKRISARRKKMRSG